MHLNFHFLNSYLNSLFLHTQKASTGHEVDNWLLVGYIVPLQTSLTLTFVTFLVVMIISFISFSSGFGSIGFGSFDDGFFAGGGRGSGSSSFGFGASTFALFAFQLVMCYLAWDHLLRITQGFQSQSRQTTKINFLRPLWMSLVSALLQPSPPSTWFEFSASSKSSPAQANHSMHWSINQQSEYRNCYSIHSITLQSKLQSYIYVQCKCSFRRRCGCYGKYTKQWLWALENMKHLLKQQEYDQKRAEIQASI